MTAVRPGSIPLDRPEPLIRADRVLYVRFRKSDLETTRRFFADFGLTVAHRTDERMLLRGAGPAPYVYIAEHGGSPAFLGTGFVANERADLETLSRASGRPIEPIDLPGGGERVRLTDPLGFEVDVVHGIAPVEPLPMRQDPLPLNTPFAKPRVNLTQRPPRAPADVWKLGHCVVQTPRFAEAAAWYMRHLGLIPTDVQCLPNGQPALAFMRTDRGDTPSDHHTFVVVTGPKVAFLHCAFEVLDIDALGEGQQVLKGGGWKHVWGIGRHTLGSQLFDYWNDPDGFEVEHYADGDVFTADHPTDYTPFERGGLWEWGDDVPASLGPQPSPGLLVDVVRGLYSGDLDFETLKQLGAALGKPPRPWLR